MRRAGRLRHACIALLAGWLAATAASLPFDLFEILRNSAGNWALMTASLGYGTAVWMVWTLTLSVVAGVVVVLPVALFVSPEFLLSHRAVVLSVSGGLGAAVVIINFWGSWRPEFGEIPAFAEYLIFTVMLALITSAMYLRMLARSRAAALLPCEAASQSL